MIRKIEEISDHDRLFQKKIYMIYNTLRSEEFLSKSEEERKKELYEIAMDFYLTFENSPIPVVKPEAETYKSNLQLSTQITIDGGCYKIPYSLYKYYMESKIDFKFIQGYEKLFVNDFTWKNFVSALFQYEHKRRIDLTSTEVEICKVLSRYNPSFNTKRVYPITSRLISLRSRKTLVSVKNKLMDLYTKQVIYDTYLINPFKLGWSLELLYYPSPVEEIISNLDPVKQWCISKDTLFGKKQFRIMQRSNINFEEDDELIKTLENNYEVKKYRIENLTYNWNLSGLHFRADKSFLQKPMLGFNSLLDIKPTTFFEDLGIDNNNSWFESECRTPEFKSSVLKTLNFITERNAPIKTLENSAKLCGLPLRRFIDSMKLILKEKVLSFAVRFNYLGLHPSYCFIITDGDKELNLMIRKHLLQLPFVHIFEGEKILAGRIRIPENWTSELFYFFNQLEEKENLSVLVGNRTPANSWRMLNIKIPENYFFDLFGAYVTTTLI